MYKVSEFTKMSYKTGEVAKILNVTTKTVQNYDKWGKLKVCRTEGDRRCIMREDLLNFLRERNLLIDDLGEKRHEVIYFRADTDEEKTNKLTAILSNMSQITNPLVLIDKSDDDSELLKLLGMLLDRIVTKLYVSTTISKEHNFKFIMCVCNKLGIEVCVVDSE